MDISLHYTDLGDGFPLVLLHGNGEDHTYFSRQIGPFSEKYRVIAIDTRGHGQSPRGDAPFTLAQFAQDLKVFLDSLGVKSCHLLGFSDGGSIALIFALHYPNYVNKLILNGANLNPLGVKATVQLPIILGWAALWTACKVNPRARSRFEMLNLMVTQPHIDAAALRNLNVPTLVVAGVHDMIRQRHTQAIAAQIQGSRLEILPGDHFVARKSWQAFNRLTLEFLQDT